MTEAAGNGRPDGDPVAARLTEALSGVTPGPARRMYRYPVPVDGIPCRIGLTGDPLAYGALACSAGIEFWAEHTDGAEPRVRTFTIVGTDEPVLDGATYVGTAPRTPEGIVWHLYELPEGAAGE